MGCLFGIIIFTVQIWCANLLKNATAAEVITDYLKLKLTTYLRLHINPNYFRRGMEQMTTVKRVVNFGESFHYFY